MQVREQAKLTCHQGQRNGCVCNPRLPGEAFSWIFPSIDSLTHMQVQAPGVHEGLVTQRKSELAKSELAKPKCYTNSADMLVSCSHMAICKGGVHNNQTALLCHLL
jgi:pentose-5-phosphate-3-epimerase